ncbi:DUF4410 domain-containing protein [Pseudorhodoferax sp. Leaf265]|jgi:hypothetical protein|uniref:DUF4410 domain-containing protein n=1 Tax=Pseudorhodoferax sp. Leaf265 TaxID=1736315 RepID=UPI0009E72FBC|nr:DUF4410 domain-containing protein [Pseudorhodoferax sp. Leaf265]PZP94329.1 MAG: DUF4410 domain-containing protein [Variovorax paradoxus]PZQ04909.1 MAG: DUF4410 domain-containing protein [Variovorax paradoxus]
MNTPSPFSPWPRLPALALCVALAGCAANVERPGSAGGNALQVPARAQTSVALVVRAASPELARSADWQALRGAWRDAMAEAAKTAGKQFQYLEAEPQSTPAGSTLVVVQVKDYRYLSTGARYGLGVMTGNAYVNADAAFYVGPGRTPVGQRSYSTSSSAWQGIFSAMTDKQLASISAAMLKDIDGG